MADRIAALRTARSRGRRQDHRSSFVVLSSQFVVLSSPCLAWNRYSLFLVPCPLFPIPYSSLLFPRPVRPAIRALRPVLQPPIGNRAHSDRASAIVRTEKEERDRLSWIQQTPWCTSMRSP